MSNKSIGYACFGVAAEPGYYRHDLSGARPPVVTHDTITVTEPDGLVYHYALANPGPPPDPALMPSLRCPAAVEGMGADGIPTLTIPAGAAVTVAQSRLQWVGKPGDEPPPVDGLDGLFTASNRVDAA